LALGMINWVNEQFEVQPFGLDNSEFIAYAADRGQRRLSAIESARGRPVAEIDLDYSPETLEEQFGEEDLSSIGR
ncbi:R2-like ligand-binding oxidase, partial [Streptomyces sp. SID10244]|nr:R2-like ligand-binding oxidase [Streptomyces sp. SID10244]